MARLHSWVKRTAYSAGWTITPIMGTQVQNSLSQKTSLYTAVNPCLWTSHLWSSLSRLPLAEKRWIQKQDTFVYFLSANLHSLSLEKKANNILQHFSFCVPLKDKKHEDEWIFWLKKIILKAAAPCILHTKCFYVKNMAPTSSDEKRAGLSTYERP